MSPLCEDRQLRLDFDLSVSLALDLSDQHWTQEINAALIAEGFDDSDEWHETKVGKIKLAVIDVGQALDDGCTIENLALRLDGAESSLGAVAFDVLERLEDLEDAYDSIFISRVLLLKEIRIERKYRNKGMGSEAIRGILKSPLFNCDLIAVKPFGIEEEQVDPDDSPDIKRSKGALLRTAEARLSALYQRLGFRRLLPEHMTFAPGLKKQPTVAFSRVFLRKWKSENPGY